MRLAFIVLRQQETWLLGGERKGGGHLMPHTKTKQNVIVSTFLDIILWSWLMAVYMVAYTHLYLYGN